MAGWSLVLLEEHCYLRICLSLDFVKLTISTMVLFIHELENISDLFLLDLGGEELRIPNYHISEEVSCLLSGVSLEDDVQISELPIAIPHTRIHVRNVK